LGDELVEAVSETKQPSHISLWQRHEKASKGEREGGQSPYSPKCVEEEFSEVRMQDLA